MYKLPLLYACLSFVALTFTFSGCVSHIPAAEIAGVYQDDVTLTVRTRENGKFVFTRAADKVHMQLTIQSDGTVEGLVGDARFVDATCTLNRGDLGRKLNVKTDFIIRGKLDGRIFANDPTSGKEVSLPFNLENGRIHGSLFQLDSPGLYPMAGPGDDTAE